MERRSSLRVPCGVLLDVIIDDERVQADLMNISQRGMFLRSNLRSPMDSLRLASAMTADSELFLHLELRGADRPLQATGQVAWKSDMGIGVDFLYLSSELSAFIDQLAHDPDGVEAWLQQIVATPSVTVRARPKF